MVYITYQDMMEILQQQVQFQFEKKNAREYKCLDILNDMPSPPNMADTFIALRKAYDAGKKDREAEERR